MKPNESEITSFWDLQSPRDVEAWMDDWEDVPFEGTQLFLVGENGDHVTLCPYVTNSDQVTQGDGPRVLHRSRKGIRSYK